MGGGYFSRASAALDAGADAAEHADIPHDRVRKSGTLDNSIVEAFWRSLKHQWLFLNSLDTVERVRALVEFFVTEHNTRMPHPAFRGQTPDEMFFGTGTKVPEELAAAKTNARAVRMAANRAMSCERCLGHQVPQPKLTFRGDFKPVAIANMK